jgi:hypothetical protein
MFFRARAGFEWYADYGAIGNISPVHNQQQQVFLVTDLNVSPIRRSLQEPVPYALFVQVRLRPSALQHSHRR